MREPVIFHIDVNSAFLSWTALARLEQGDPVDLRTIPSIVGGDTSTRHGVVLAKSIPARLSASLPVNRWSMPCANVRIWSWLLRIIICTV